jgi:hypothetical protein
LNNQFWDVQPEPADGQFAGDDFQIRVEPLRAGNNWRGRCFPGSRSRSWVWNILARVLTRAKH